MVILYLIGQNNGINLFKLCVFLGQSTILSNQRTNQKSHVLQNQQLCCLASFFNFLETIGDSNTFRQLQRNWILSYTATLPFPYVHGEGQGGHPTVLWPQYEVVFVYTECSEIPPPPYLVGYFMNLQIFYSPIKVRFVL